MHQASPLSMETCFFFRLQWNLSECFTYVTKTLFAPFNFHRVSIAHSFYSTMFTFFLFLFVHKQSCFTDAIAITPKITQF